MEHTRRVNRGLRYLCLEQYKDTSPELIAANIIKLRLLQSFDLNVVYLPAHPGFPHDGAVRIPQDPREPERLIWFDFMVLLEDEPGTATRRGTMTMAQVGKASPPAFYIVIFPDSPQYMAIVPHAVAWQEGDSDLFDIPCTGITGLYFPYLMPEHLLPLALKGISMIPWGSLYTNPGTGVVLKQSRRDSPTLPLLGQPLSWAPGSSNSAGKKRRRDSDDQDDCPRLAPAFRETESQTIMPLVGAADFGFDASWAEHDLFGFDWPLPDQPVLPVLQETAPGSLLEAGVTSGQQPLEHVYPSSSQLDVSDFDTGVGGDEFSYPGYNLFEMWSTGLEGVEEGTHWSAESRTLLLATQLDSATTVDAQQYKQVAPLRAIAPAPLAVEAGPSHISAATAPVDSPSEPRQSSSVLAASSKAETTDSESEEENEEDAPPRRLIELHHEHPWCNHIYLPPSTQDTLTQLLAPDTVCLPVITNPSDTADGDPMPLSVLSIARPCLHVLSSRSSPNKFFLLPSRWVDFLHCSLNQLLNSTQGDSKRSALRGTNKIVTENPTVDDAFKRYGIVGVDGGAELSWGLWDAWIREFKRKTPYGMTREEDRNACCLVSEVLQVQVDWSMRMFSDLLV
ncbi:hypothetical protein E4T49_01313 [Aureobasidium sp. EXF-10728]|nr:hypothetical protein E4T49_01313 [Aureobasidium sp. EXF-10728]